MPVIREIEGRRTMKLKSLTIFLRPTTDIYKFAVESIATFEDSQEQHFKGASIDRKVFDLPYTPEKCEVIAKEITGVLTKWFNERGK